MKTSELTGAALDWAVAKVRDIQDDRIVLQGRVQFPGEKVPRQIARVFVRWLAKEHASPQAWAFCGQRYEPSSDWVHGGPILDRERPRISPTMSGGFTASKKIVEMLDDGGFNTRWVHGTGPTILVAAMRCFVVSKHGEEIEIPAELKA